MYRINLPSQCNGGRRERCTLHVRDCDPGGSARALPSRVVFPCSRPQNISLCDIASLADVGLSRPLGEFGVVLVARGRFEYTDLRLD